jgi:pSer/pThr/pTyr-binding forkhead associated (FHA) protein
VVPARLTLHFPAAPARELALAGETVVGRDPECGVVIEDDRVSRRHARLVPVPETAGWAGWAITDLGSKNGTLVDGLPIPAHSAGPPRPLAARSWLSFGGVIAGFAVVASEGRGAGETLHEERQRRLISAREAGRGLDPRLGLPELLSRVVASMLALTNAERGFLLLARADGELEVAARSGLSWDDLRAAEFGGSVGAVERALSGQAVVSADVSTDAELGERASVVKSGIRALLCVPVQALDRRLGVMYADSRKPGAAFTELDLEILEALAVQAGLALAVAGLDDELRGLARQVADPRRDTWHGLLARAPLEAPS